MCFASSGQSPRAPGPQGVTARRWWRGPWGQAGGAGWLTVWRCRSSSPPAGTRQWAISSPVGGHGGPQPQRFGCFIQGACVGTRSTAGLDAVVSGGSPIRRHRDPGSASLCSLALPLAGARVGRCSRARSQRAKWCLLASPKVSASVPGALALADLKTTAMRLFVGLHPLNSGK